MLKWSSGFGFFLASLFFSVRRKCGSHCLMIFLEDIQFSPWRSAGAAHCPPLTSVPLALRTSLARRRLQVQFQGFPSRYKCLRRGRPSRALRSKADSLLFLRFKTWSCFRSLSSRSAISWMAFPLRSSLAKVPGSLQEHRAGEEAVSVIPQLSEQHEAARATLSALFCPFSSWNRSLVLQILIIKADPSLILQDLHPFSEVLFSNCLIFVVPHHTTRNKGNTEIPIFKLAKVIN